MKQDIARYIEECDVCRRVKAEHQKPAGLLQPLPIPEWKWDKIQMDFVTGLPKSQKGNDAIFVVIDQFSKVAHFLPVKETITASQLATLYISRIVSLHGIPKEISSDCCSIFTSKFWDCFQEAMGTHITWSTTYHPQSQGQSSESIKFLKTCFGLALFLLARSRKNLSLMRSSLITTAIKPA